MQVNVEELSLSLRTQNIIIHSIHTTSYVIFLTLMICKKQWYRLLCSHVCSQHRLLTGQLYATRLCCDYKTLSCGRLLSHSTLVMPDIDNQKNHHLILIMSSVVTNTSADSTINLQLPFLFSYPKRLHQTNFLFWVGNKLCGWVCLVLKSTTTRTGVPRIDEVARW